MISIIISNYQEDKFASIKKNLKSTIGNVDYEIIKIFNPGIMGISNAYNKGARLAKFPYLLFIHDDIKFLSINWGKGLLKLFQIENTGVIGLAGGKKKSNLPTGHDLGIDKYRCVQVCHSENEKIALHPFPVKIKTLDGVFLALSKERWQEFKFNETIKGFHFYDLDISLRISEKYQNYIVPNIQILHFSKGAFNDNWVEAVLTFHSNIYNFDNIKKSEKIVIKKFWFKRLLFENISFKNRLKYVAHMGFDINSGKDAIRFLFSKKTFNTKFKI